MTDHDAMLAIQREVDGVEWTPDTLDRIAEILRAAGYQVRDPEEFLSCPVGDPDCLGGEGECHDACERPER